MYFLGAISCYETTYIHDVVFWHNPGYENVAYKHVTGEKNTHFLLLVRQHHAARGRPERRDLL